MTSKVRLLAAAQLIEVTRPCTIDSFKESSSKAHARFITPSSDLESSALKYFPYLRSNNVLAAFNPVPYRSKLT